MSGIKKGGRAYVIAQLTAKDKARKRKIAQKIQKPRPKPQATKA